MGLEPATGSPHGLVGQGFCTCTVSGFHVATFQILPTLSFADFCSTSTHASSQMEAGEHTLKEGTRQTGSGTRGVQE